MIAAADEQLHVPGEERHWQESYYFNWADAGGQVFGLARVGYRFAEGRADGLVLAICDGRPEYAYPGVNVRGIPPAQGRPAGTYAAGKLALEVVEPLRRFRLTLDGPHRMDLVFDAFTDAFDYKASGASTFAPELAASHFEQAGTVEGWTEFRGKRREVSGSGQRDKSWGVRDWGAVAGWDWISGQFGTGAAFNATLVVDAAGAKLPSGFVHVDGDNHALTGIDLDYDWGGRSHEPAAVRLRLEAGGAREWTVTGAALGRFPLLRKGAWLEEVHTRFTLSDGVTERTGYGVIEHVWRPSTVEVLRRSCQLPALMRVMSRP